MKKAIINKILTISIPTYNRGILLIGLLESIIKQVNKFNLQDKVEVQITNNNSSDNTDEIIKSYLSKCDFIFYTKNETNIGLGPNVLKCMQLANGKYCLLLGDDDRLKPNSLPNLINFLENNTDTGLLIDTTLHKKFRVEEPTSIDLISFLEKYYYFMGNAGVFITLSMYIKENYGIRNFEGHSFSWPQTQFMIISAYRHPELKIRLNNFDLLSESEHSNITLYNSFYLWKVAYYELVTDIGNLKPFVSKEVINAGRKYFLDNAVQNLFNILQCGVFVDDKETKSKTRNHILTHLSEFTLVEKLILLFIAFVLWLPESISKSLSNIFIYAIRGQKGLDKKNAFVNLEQSKIKIIKNKKDTILREFSFDGSRS